MSRPPVPSAASAHRRAPVRWWSLLAWVALLTACAAASANLGPMRDLLANGHFNAAAQLEGPNLVERFPADPEARFLYARAAYLTGNVAVAREQIDVALDLARDPPPPDYVHLHGMVLAAEGQVDDALRALRNAFVRSRAYRHAMDWGVTAWRAGRFDEALRAYEEAGATEQGRLDPWPHLNRGRLLQARGNVSEAEAAFRSAIEVFEASDPGGARPPSPAYVEAFYRLGALHEAAGDLTRAEQDYKAARSIDPNYTPAVRALDELARRAP